jgi:diaminopimelate epimerase
MSLAFTKMHGLSNDFMVLEAQHAAALPTAAGWRELADRHTGVGFDQALVILPPRTANTHAYYRVFNADGGEVEQCGNGVRCVAEWLRRQGRSGSDLLRLESRSGIIEARFAAPGIVAVNMGEPRFASADRSSLQLDAEHVTYTEVSMGNPHIVLEVDDIDAAPVAHLGPRLESHPRFPARTNVGFLQIIDRRHAKLRVYERGVGETRACGTGACAAMATGRRAGAFDDEVAIALPGGTLSLRWPGAGEPLWMTGPAAVSFHGEIGD